MFQPWRKAPTAMVAELATCSWSREHPAPDLVGFMWAKSIVMDGGHVSSRNLQAYAGWTHWRARQVLKQVHEFVENYECTNQPHDSAQSPHTSRTPPAHPTEVEPTTIDDSPHTSRTPPAQSPHTTRARDPSYQKEKEKKREVESIWDEMNLLRTSRGGRSLTLTAARSRSLLARIREHSAEEVRLVFSWWLTSEHERAELLREKFNIDTVLRPSRFPGYLDFAMQERQPAVSPDLTRYQAGASRAWDLVHKHITGMDFNTVLDAVSDAQREPLVIAARLLGGGEAVAQLRDRHGPTMPAEFRDVMVRVLRDSHDNGDPT